jgi:hypothetical protein
MSSSTIVSSLLERNTQAPAIYLAGVDPVPGPEPMDIVSEDYPPADDHNDSEGLESLGIMNDTEDAFAFYAISTLPSGKQPKMHPFTVPPFSVGTSTTVIVDKLDDAFACWGILAGMQWPGTFRIRRGKWLPKPLWLQKPFVFR